MSGAEAQLRLFELTKEGRGAERDVGRDVGEGNVLITQMELLLKVVFRHVVSKDALICFLRIIATVVWKPVII